LRVDFGADIEVIATERWLDETRGGRAFARGGVLAASVGNLGHHQIFNPAASGVIALVRAVIASLGSADAIILTTHNTALTTLVGAGTNLLFGGAAGACVYRTQNNAALLGTEITRVLLQANLPINVALEWFGELGPAEGLVVATGNANIQSTAFFQWIEVV